VTLSMMRSPWDVWYILLNNFLSIHVKQVLARDFDKRLATCYDAPMRRLKPGDFVILIISVAIILLSMRSFGEFSGKPEVRVRAGGKQWVYDLSVDTRATFDGPVGSTTMEIEGGKVHVHDSDCRNKVCIAAGWISRPGQWIICLPNDVFILIEGSEIQEEGGADDTAF